MTFKEAIAKNFAAYGRLFEGRATRSEFWKPQLALVLMVLALYAFVGVVVLFGAMADPMAGPPILLMLLTIPMGLISLGVVVYLYVMLLPTLATLVRRLHDTGRSGWWYWIALVPLVGMIVLIVFLAQRGTDGPNKFGPDPFDGGQGGSNPDGSYRATSIPSVGN